MRPLASWNWSYNGVSYPFIYDLVIDPMNPATLYAGSVYKSTNAGATWSHSGLYTTTLALAIDHMNPATLYAGTSYLGVYKSADSGGSWSTSNTGLTDTYISELVIDPANPATIYAGTYGGSGVFKSVNGGASWKVSNTGLTQPGVNVMAIDPSNVDTIYAGTYSSLFKSVDGGASWSDTGIPNGGVIGLAIDPVTSATVYAGTYGRVYKTSIGGVSWNATGGGLPTVVVTALAIDPTNPATIYAGMGGGGVFKSVNGGASWQPTGITTGGGSATTVSTVSGDGQSGTGGQPLRYPFVVVVSNAAGNPVAGVPVTFDVTSGGGTLSAASVVTDAQGVALSRLTLGTEMAVNTVTATATGLAGSPQMFKATTIALPGAKRVRGQLTSQ